MFYRSFVICVSALFLSSCNIYNAYDLDYVPPNPKTGRFPVSQLAKPSEILVSKRVNLHEYKKLLVVGISNTASNNKVENNPRFWERSLQSLGYFDDVISTGGLRQFLVNTTQDENIPDIVDAQSLREAEKIYGKFLLVEVETNDSNTVKTTFTLRATDPITGEIFFEARQQQRVIYIARDSYNSVLNAFEDWVKQNS